MRRTLSLVRVGPNKVGHNIMNILQLTYNTHFKILNYAKP